ncbi:YqzL family protein [Paenibacillus darwinianus]|uniref:YqzL family protein n=1 Tax=Paenibacillus darwinianus TaxID=1380763 RepID=UPI0009DCC26E|nr:YqzL family protein [Paenibacillus darwinianus]
MRDFSWTYFTLTGDLDAFLLYKQMDDMKASEGADGPGDAFDALDEWEDADG